MHQNSLSQPNCTKTLSSKQNLLRRSLMASLKRKSCCSKTELVKVKTSQAPLQVSKQIGVRKKIRPLNIGRAIQRIMRNSHSLLKRPRVNSKITLTWSTKILRRSVWCRCSRKTNITTYSKSLIGKLSNTSNTSPKMTRKDKPILLGLRQPFRSMNRWWQISPSSRRIPILLFKT